MCFSGLGKLHPAAYLLSWLILAVALQHFAWPAMALALVVLLVTGRPVLLRWGRLLRRVRWLLLSLWLIMAYGIPGEAWLGYAWAPTYEGLDEASRQAGHLMLLLGALAWLFERLPREKLVAACWALSQPLLRLGVDTRRLVARLSLVFEMAEHAPKPGHWKELLHPAMTIGGADVVRIELPAWQFRDGMFCVMVTTMAVLGVLLP